MKQYPSTVACPTCTQEMTYWHGDYYCQPCEDAWDAELTDAERAEQEALGAADFHAWYQPADDGDTGSTFDSDNEQHVILVTWYERYPVAGACISVYPITATVAAGELVDSLYASNYGPTCTYLNRLQTVALIESLSGTLHVW